MIDVDEVVATIVLNYISKNFGLSVEDIENYPEYKEEILKYLKELKLEEINYD